MTASMVGGMTLHSPPEAKIALFRSLFRGREDVYPRRFESRRTGRAGYQPVCGNEWVRGICEKPRIKCSECACQRFLGITDEVVRAHLSGVDGAGRPFVMGVYPMLLDESCHFLAADFDGEHWREDSLAVLAACRRLDLPGALERSRSGDGGHLWLFFAEAIPAALARNLGSLLLTATMDARPELGLRSYDRLFPNQDTLPKGGFGNLIALPLQREARARGNSVFVDETFTPHPDQWAYLASLARVSRARVEALVGEARRRGRILDIRHVAVDEEDQDRENPWAAPPSRVRRDQVAVGGPLPESLELVLGDQIYVAKGTLTAGLRNRLIRLAAFQNPDFYRAQGMRLPTYDKPRIIACAEDSPEYIGLPRGCLDDVRGLLGACGVAVSLRDERCSGKPIAVKFVGELRLDQRPAAGALLAHETGVLSATTGFGKTVIGAWLIAERKVNTLVLVHRRQLLEQWIERLTAFLDLPPKSIGRLGGGRRRLTGIVDVALIQSLVRKGVVDDVVGEYGQVIVDECHHVSAVNFELAIRRVKARYIAGLSATIARKDGHHPVTLMQCGPVRYRVDAKREAAARPFTHQVLVRPTGFRFSGEPEDDPRLAYQAIGRDLAGDEGRNRLICADVREAVRAGRHPLVLTERTDHLERIEAGLRSEGLAVIVLRGGMDRRSTDEARAGLTRASEVEAKSRGTAAAVADGHGTGGPEAMAAPVVLATGRFVGEGFDEPRLDTLFLAFPVSWRGTIAQYVGRLHRLRDGKRAVQVYDYADLDVPMLGRMLDRRCRGYEAVGYTILLPASALPGWPVEVPLPVDPGWKRDYAASISRLIRDGVDVGLGRLFVHAARRPEPGAEGVERARSASEAFLFRRLETLAPTVGRFRLNTVLPIPFDERGGMEVDLLDPDSRLVIELDGAQHLGDVAAYRRDRRKDVLLQEHGYHVLRFLTDDLGRELDGVLDAILRALVHRSRARVSGVG